MQQLLAYLIILQLNFQDGWRTNFDQSLADAKTSNKLLLLKFSGSDWCIPCMRMDKEIFADTSFKTFSDSRLVLVYADFPRKSRNKLSADLKKQNEMLAAKYNPAGKFPFTILMNGEGKILRSWDGYPDGGKAAFLESVQKIDNDYHR